MPASLSVEAEGLTETLAALRGLERDLRAEANSEIRAGARVAAEGLAAELRRSAASSPTPVARRVASSIKVKSDRFPTVSIGGTKRVGRRGAIAAKLVWGSEHGGAKFGAPAGGTYWIAPAVRRFEMSGAVPIFRRAVYEIVKRRGLA
jgi:hypothetical protein